MALNLSPGAQVVRYYRLRIADDMALALERTVVPQAVLPDPSLVENSLYETFAEDGPAPGARAAAPARDRLRRRTGAPDEPARRQSRASSSNAAPSSTTAASSSTPDPSTAATPTTSSPNCRASNRLERRHHPRRHRRPACTPRRTKPPTPWRASSPPTRRLIDALVERLQAQSAARSSSPARAAVPTTPRPTASTCSRRTLRPGHGLGLAVGRFGLRDAARSSRARCSSPSRSRARARTWCATRKSPRPPARMVVALVNVERLAAGAASPTR